MTRGRMAPSRRVAEWERRGVHRALAGWKTFTIEIPAVGGERLEPLLVLHGFPTCSYDFHHVVEKMAERRRVLLLDMIGYGLSDKPDLAYTIDLQADVVEAFVAELGLSRLALLTHDLGDTVGGELLARNLDGEWSVEVTRRVVTNGSVYIAMAHLSEGQELLLGLPDERLPGGGAGRAELIKGLAATFSSRSSVDGSELADAWELIRRHEGHRMLPRTVRYIEERRRNERRYTGAIESHPSPLSIVWGTDDPIAVAEMASRLHDARPDSRLTWLEGVGHYPMLESPGAFAEAVRDGLA